MEEIIKIDKWSQTLNENGSSIPVLFFRPTLSFLTYLNQNKKEYIPIQIFDTNGIYDIQCYARYDTTTRLYNSCGMPATPPFSVLFLQTDFTVYPEKNGFFFIRNV